MLLEELHEGRVAEEVSVDGRRQAQNIVGHNGNDIVLGQQNGFDVVDDLVLGEYDDIVALHTILLAIDDHTTAISLAEDDDKTALQKDIARRLTLQLQSEIDEKVLTAPFCNELCYIHSFDVFNPLAHKATFATFIRQQM